MFRLMGEAGTVQPLKRRNTGTLTLRTGSCLRSYRLTSPGWRQSSMPNWQRKGLAETSLVAQCAV
jgi:hypothetical protein